MTIELEILFWIVSKDIRSETLSTKSGQANHFDMWNYNLKKLVTKTYDLSNDEKGKIIAKPGNIAIGISQTYFALVVKWKSHTLNKLPTKFNSRINMDQFTHHKL